MVVACIVEVVRLREVAALGLQNSTAPVPMSVFWLIPQYFIIGCAEIMARRPPAPFSACALLPCEPA